MSDTCRLCGNCADLQESHIIPKFIIKHQKQTSATGYFRTSANPNCRAQDGPKCRLLCASCEGLFNKWETQFANTIYRPWCQREFVRRDYGPWMLKFAVSVSWRNLIWHLDKAAGKIAYSEDAQKLMAEALDTWRRFMFDEIPNPRSFEQHMLLWDLVEGTTNATSRLPQNINRYLTRCFDADVPLLNGMPAFVFTRMGKVMLLGFIGMDQRRDWDDTKLRISHGRIGGEISVPATLFDYIVDRARLLQSQYGTLSDKQYQVIDDAYRQNPARGAGSESFQTMTHDYELFGLTQVFNKKHKESQ